MTESRAKSPYWQRALGLLRRQLTPAQAETWLAPILPLKLSAPVVQLGCPNRFYQTWLEERYGQLIKDALTCSGLAVEEVRFEVVPSRPGAEAAEPAPILELNREYTFETFVVADGNRLAYEAAHCVAEEPGRRYNPLVICGHVGEGKTHLLHAVGHALLEGHPELRVLQLTASGLFERLVRAVRENRATELRKELRATDVLLMDDVHTLAGREGTQEEFFHYFNALHTAGKQLVLTSRALPAALAGVAERIRSRLAWGLVVELEPGDGAFRLHLAQEVAQRLHWPVPADLLEEFVEPLEVNNRELIGLLLRAAATCKLTGDEPRAVLSDIGRQRRTQAPPATIERVIRTVSQRLGLSIRELRGPRRARPLAHARHLVAYLAHEYANFSLPAIGRALGGRDHTTILHSVRKAASLLREDRNFAELVRAIRRELSL